MSKIKVKRGRKELINIFREHFGVQNIFPELEKILASVEPNSRGKFTIKIVGDALRENTGIVFGNQSFKKMVDTYQRGRVLKDSILGQMLRNGYGPPKGICKGLVRNPAGRPKKVSEPTPIAVEPQVEEVAEVV